MDALTRELYAPPRPAEPQPQPRPAPITYGGLLTDQEAAVLRLIADGHTYEEIAFVRYMAVDTVRSYARRIYRRLGARCAAHAVHIAHERGLFRADARHG